MVGSNYTVAERTRQVLTCTSRLPSTGISGNAYGYFDGTLPRMTVGSAYFWYLG